MSEEDLFRAVLAWGEGTGPPRDANAGAGKGADARAAVKRRLKESGVSALVRPPRPPPPPAPTAPPAESSCPSFSQPSYRPPHRSCYLTTPA